MPNADRPPMPYHLVVPLQELERTIHGGGPSEVEADVVFTPITEMPQPHPDFPAKVRAGFRMMHGRLEVRLVDIVPTPEQLAEKAEHEAWKAGRAARETAAAMKDLADRQADGRWQPGVGSEDVPAPDGVVVEPPPAPLVGRDEFRLGITGGTVVVLGDDKCPPDGMNTAERIAWLKARLDELPASAKFFFNARRGARGVWELLRS